MQISQNIFCVLLVVFMSPATHTYSQNLVINPSFEDTVPCGGIPPPWLPSCNSACIPLPWFSPYFGSPDYYNYYWATSCGYPGAGDPNYYNLGSLGFQFPKTGNGMMGIGVYNGMVIVREYIEGLLTGPLIQGHVYCVEFYLSLGNNSQRAIRNVGAYFSPDSLLDFGTDFLNLGLTPHIQPAPSTMLSDTLTWMLVSGVYTANGGERFITIGNFLPDSLTDTAVVVPATQNMGWNQTAYYLIDDVSVVDCTVGLEEQIDIAQLQFSPNPTYGEIDFDLGINQQSVAEVLDITGRLVLKQEMEPGGKRHNVDMKALPGGVYLVRVLAGGRPLAAGRVVKM